jgi:hypothetical protein
MLSRMPPWARTRCVEGMIVQVYLNLFDNIFGIKSRVSMCTHGFGDIEFCDGDIFCARASVVPYVCDEMHFGGLRETKTVDLRR